MLAGILRQAIQDTGKGEEKERAMADTNQATEAKEQIERAPARTAATEAGADGIDFTTKGDIINVVAQAGTGRRQSLSGFAPDYTDIVDYIIRATHKMWEEGGIGLLYDHYAQNTVTWSDWGTIFGRERTIERDVVDRLAGFPDQRIYAEDVVWTGNDVDGFRTCHRAMVIAHHTGYSKYGPPTGRRIQRRSFANCVVRENRVVEEWLIQDELTVVRQLGLNVDDVLRELSNQIDARTVQDIVGEVPRVAGQTTPAVYIPRHSGRFDVEDFVRQGVSEIWNWRLLNKIPTYYAANCPVHGPSNRELYGHGDIRAFVLALLQAFPDAMIEIDDLYWNGSERGSYRTAMRWTLLGTHRGYGIGGRPTGKPIRIMGTTEHHIRDGKIVEEWTLFNELALLWKLRYAA
jgi:predicted ester cyclase